jgi:hypothetical protein
MKAIERLPKEKKPARAHSRLLSRCAIADYRRN